MFGKKKKCIICHKEIAKENAIKKYASYFCSNQCLKKYEKLLQEVKKTKLDNCC